MDRDNEALRRRMTGTAGDPAESQESSDDDGTYVVREGVTRAIDPDELELRRQGGLTEDDNAARVHADIAGFDPDRELARPPVFPESLDVATVAPDGTTVPGRTSQLTDPLTGEAIGGSGLSDQIQSRAGELGGDALGGSRLDPLGMLNSSDVGSPTDREVEQAISAHDGSQAAFGVSVGGYGFDYNPSGSDGGTTVGVGVGPVEVRGTQADLDAITDYFEKAVDDLKDVVTGGSDDEGGRPDPTAGDDVLTGESIAAAIRVNDPGVYAQPTQDGAESGGTAAAVERAAAVNDPQNITNYGPEGPQNVEVADNWAPPTDGIFDPPAEGASAGMVGAESATADPAAALGGSVIGSSTPDDFPPPPDPPPGDNPDDGPPDGGGGDEG